MTAAGWLILAILGQAAALLLVNAGPVVRYQHYSFDFDLWTGFGPWLLVILLLQAGLVVLFGRHHMSTLVAWVRRKLRPWQWIVIALVVLATCAAPSRSPLVYAWESVFAFVVQMLCLSTILLWAASLGGPARRRATNAFARILGAEQSKDRGVDGLTVVGAIWVTALAAFLGYTSYEWHPHLPDEVAYLLQSRYMALGWLSAPMFPVQEAFTPEMLIVDADRWFSIFPPGWPGILAVGQRLGGPWLVNPLLAGSCVIIARLLVGETHGRSTARLVVVLLCTSPWFVFLAMSLMAHTASLACALLGAWAVARARRGAPAWALLAGAAVGGLSLIRPLEGVVGGVVLGLWVVWPAARRRKVAAPMLFSLAAVAIGSLSLVYNHHLTGDPLRFPIMEWAAQVYGPGANSLGFGPDRGFGWTGLDPLPGHGLLDALINADLNSFAVNVELLGWGTGSLLLLLVFLFAGHPQRRDWGYAGAAVCVAGIQSLYWFSGGPDFGARYWFLILVPCLLLTARGIEWLRENVPVPGVVPAALFGLVLSSFLTFYPWRAIDKYHGYRGMRPGLEELARESNFGEDLVLIRGPLHPDYHSAVILNPVTPNPTETLFARDVDPGTRARLEQAFPARSIRVVDGPSRTGNGFHVVEVPTRRLPRADDGPERGDNP